MRILRSEQVIDALFTESHEGLPARIQQMIDVLLANQALICQYSYGHIELHYKDGQVQACMKHQLLAE